MKKIITISLAFLTITLAGCLDDDKYALDPSGTENVIEFLETSVAISPLGAVHPAYVNSFAVSSEDEFNVIISYSGPNSNNKDIDLTLEVDPLALAAFNAQQESDTFTPYEMLPSNLYVIESMTVTLPKGQTKLTIPITVFPDQFDLSKKYAIPLRIASASSGTLSTVYSAAIFGVVVKNRYDGLYTISEESTMVDVTTPAFAGIYPKNISLRTVDGSTVDYYDEDYHLAGHVFFTGTGASYFGGFLARFTFDNTTGNVLSVVNALGQGNNNRAAKLDPAQPTTPQMTFEADNLTPIEMEVWYIMRQTNTSVDRVFWKETYEYVGPRP